MPKKQKTPKVSLPPIPSFPISRHKSFLFNLNSFTRMLSTSYTSLSSRQYITQIHKFIAQFKQLSKKKDPSIESLKNRIKICRICDGWNGKEQIVQCMVCEDWYHSKCLATEKQAFQERGNVCEECCKQKQKFSKVEYLAQFMEDRCQQCDQERQGRQAFVHCLRCSHRFHKQCYGKVGVVCMSCKSQIDIQLKTKKHVQQSTLDKWCSSKKKQQHGTVQSTTRISFKTSGWQQSEQFMVKYKYQEQSRTMASRQKDMFVCNYQGLSQQQIQKYKNSLMFAILAKNMQYTQQLQPQQCQLDTNNEQSLDFGLDHMSKTQLDIYRRYKRQPIGPFLLVYRENMGYDVVADKDIKERTLICEYIGEVVSLRKCIELEASSKNDSIMELRTGCNSDETLIIRPQKKANMARFLNGINNSKGSNKANVATVRKLARGVPAVVLFSIRPIKKGQSLLYDYNAGATTCKYDTSNFV